MQLLKQLAPDALGARGPLPIRKTPLERFRGTNVTHRAAQFQLRSRTGQIQRKSCAEIEFKALAVPPDFLGDSILMMTHPKKII